MREREFDRNEVLKKAMSLFWKKGYYDTSVQDLVEHTHVARSGLYGEFGDKHTLFLNALDHYIQQVSEGMLGDLNQPEAGLTEIRGFFEGLMQFAENQYRGQLGCLMCNTAIELAPDDQDVAVRVKDFFDSLRKLFRRAIENGQKSGEIRTDINALAYGDYLLGVMQGLAVLGRSPVERSVIRRFVHTALDPFV